jgi:hypothetical protein
LTKAVGTPTRCHWAIRRICCCFAANQFNWSLERKPLLDGERSKVLPSLKAPPERLWTSKWTGWQRIREQRGRYSPRI